MWRDVGQYAGMSPERLRNDPTSRDVHRTTQSQKERDDPGSAVPGSATEGAVRTSHGSGHSTVERDDVKLPRARRALLGIRDSKKEDRIASRRPGRREDRASSREGSPGRPVWADDVE